MSESEASCGQESEERFVIELEGNNVVLLDILEECDVKYLYDIRTTGAYNVCVLGSAEAVQRARRLIAGHIEELSKL